MLNHEALVQSAYQLQPLAPSAARLAEIMGQVDPDFGAIVEVISYDPVLTMRLLRVANSAASSAKRTIATVKEAVVRLGQGAALCLAIGSCARPLMNQAIPGYAFSGGELWRHSVSAALAAEVAQSFCRVPGPPESFTAALLHDIGKLVLGPFLTPDLCALLHRAVAEGGMESFQAETEVLSVHHGELGGVIAQHWKLPERIVQGIIHHHDPEVEDEPICHVVHLANATAHRLEARETTDREAAHLARTRDRLGLTQESFETLCATVGSRLEALGDRYG